MAFCVNVPHLPTFDHTLKQTVYRSGIFSHVFFFLLYKSVSSNKKYMLP